MPPDGGNAKHDYLTRFGVTPCQRQIVERAAQEFEATGQWVDFDTLADEAALRDDTAFDLNEVFTLPSVLGGPWAEERVSLTGLGLLAARTAPRCAELMTRVTRVAVERRMQFRSEAKIGYTILVQEHGFAAEEARRALDLVQMVPGLNGGGSLGDDWSLSVFRGTLEYRKVKTPGDLLAVLADQAQARVEAYRQVAARGPSLFTPIESVVSVEPPIVFLSWGGAVSGDVATELQTVLQPRLQTANVFLSTTSIDPGDDPMEQMIDEGLLKATVLVAVLTAEASTRPWVIWETASAWARESLVIPIFVDVKPSQIPGPLTMRVQGVHLDSKRDRDRAIRKIAARLGVAPPALLTDAEHTRLIVAARTDRGGVQPPVPTQSEVILEATGGVLTGSGVLSMPLKGSREVIDSNPNLAGERVVVARLHNNGTRPVTVESFTVMYTFAKAASGAEMTLLGATTFRH